ncbi:MAG: peptidase [Rhizobacter sp.]|nr:peptidase [Rhizobacter sp.]
MPTAPRSSVNDSSEPSVFAARIAAAQAALARRDLAAVLVPSSDPHLSEYLPARWQGRQWLSGFTGSMATLVVTQDKAALFADSRYWTQAEAELARSGIELVRIQTGAATHHIEWLTKQLSSGQALGVDGTVLGLGAAQQLRKAMDAAGIALRTDVDLIDELWPERPGLPEAPVYEHEAPQASSDRPTRLARLREALAERGASHHFISTTDDIAWLLNLRGSDVDFNPVFLAHALVEPTRATLFVGAHKVSPALEATLAKDGVHIAPYADAAAALTGLPTHSVLWIDPRRLTLALREAVNDAVVTTVEATNPTTMFKSRKSADDARFVREAMELDGAAMCAFYARFEKALGHERVTELTVDEWLTAERARQPGFKSLSFATIAGFNANGAMPHYRATEASHDVISTAEGLAATGLLLIDSGAQYTSGTTDITRVWPIGEPSVAQKRDYTLVLKGTLALSRTRFPRGTLSPMLDAIARAPLWSQGLDYGHGTGHGVGYFLNVHEGPQSISKAMPEAQMAMEPGMITSIEPGLYRPAQWGVRIENLVLNVAATTPEGSTFGDFLEFETLTLCPIDTRCIDRSLLTQEETTWLNGYHAEVLRRLAPRVEGDALAWLEARTKPV